MAGGRVSSKCEPCGGFHGGPGQYLRTKASPRPPQNVGQHHRKLAEGTGSPGKELGSPGEARSQAQALFPSLLSPCSASLTALRRPRRASWHHPSDIPDLGLFLSTLQAPWCHRTLCACVPLSLSMVLARR